MPFKQIDVNKQINDIKMNDPLKRKKIALL